MNNCLKLFFLVMMISSCTHSPQDRTIPFEGIENARELGGLVMQDGRSIRPGKLVRCGSLSAYLESALGFSALDQEKLRSKLLK